MPEEADEGAVHCFQDGEEVQKLMPLVQRDACVAATAQSAGSQLKRQRFELCLVVGCIIHPMMLSQYSVHGSDWAVIELLLGEEESQCCDVCHTADAIAWLFLPVAQQGLQCLSIPSISSPCGHGAMNRI